VVFAANRQAIHRLGRSKMTFAKADGYYDACDSAPGESNLDFHLSAYVVRLHGVIQLDLKRLREFILQCGQGLAIIAGESTIYRSLRGIDLAGSRSW
jgi:hypothetical protein